VIARLRACLDPEAFPYERNVAHWGDEIRNACIVTGAALASSPVWLGWPRLVAVLGLWLPIWSVTALLVVLGVYLALRGGWLGGFVWADLGPEERWRELWVGCPHAPDIFPICTKESFTGFAGSSKYGQLENAVLREQWNRGKFKATVDRRWAGDPGSGRFDVLPPEEQTWAVRFHHRVVRPRLIRRGEPGYPWLRHGANGYT
jgi:hypothetical protein